MAKVSKTKGGNKKHGRNKIDCEVYRREGRYEKARRRKLDRHLARFSADTVAQTALERFT